MAGETSRESLNKVATHPLQTREWEEFRKRWGNEVIRLPFGLITLHRIPFTPYKIGMFIKGPVPTAKMLTKLKDIGRKYNLIFIKLEPNVALEFPISNFQFPIKSGSTNPNFKTKYSKGGLTKLLKSAGAVTGKTLFTPTTFWIDLTKSEEELLASFHSKTRYNIRLAQKNGVTVVEDNSDKAFDKYIELTKETVTRQGFYAHSEKYHRLMWQILYPAGIAHLLVAKYKGEIITTWILFVWKDFFYYPYGASSDKYKNVMANNLMMWEAIRLGKKLGLKTFDLWGREPGKGFTKFKEGYSPQVVEFLGTWDLVINKPLYWIYRIAEKIRWISLRLFAKIGLSKYRF